MKALKTSISIMELQKIIKQWKSRKITDSTISKLLDLYLGLTAYMYNPQNEAFRLFRTNRIIS